jgi:hypothetical protein
MAKTDRSRPMPKLGIKPNKITTLPSPATFAPENALLTLLFTTTRRVNPSSVL